MDNNQNNQNNKSNGGGRRPGGFFTAIIFFALMALLLIWMLRIFKNDNSSEISYNEFLTMIEEQKIEKVVIGADTIEIKPIDEEKSVSKL